MMEKVPKFRGCGRSSYFFFFFFLAGRHNFRGWCVSLVFSNDWTDGPCLSVLNEREISANRRPSNRAQSFSSSSSSSFCPQRIAACLFETLFAVSSPYRILAYCRPTVPTIGPCSLFSSVICCISPSALILCQSLCGPPPPPPPPVPPPPPPWDFN